MGKRQVVAVLLGLSLLFAVASFKEFSNASSRTIIVPDDFTTIQAAVGMASAGDMVFVKRGTYHETVEINKPLTLIGEDPTKTTIVGLNLSYGQPPPVISIARRTSNVTVSGFTLTGDNNAGMWINEGSYNCTIKDNIITKNSIGIHTFSEIDASTGLEKPANTLIIDNYITDSDSYGIYCGTPNVTISRNIISQNGWNGIIIDSAFNVTVNDNEITNNGAKAVGSPEISGGLNLRWHGPFDVFRNNLSRNQGYGIQFGEGCYNSSVSDNIIEGNLIGVNILNFPIDGDATLGIGNNVLGNNLIENSRQAVVETQWRYYGGEFTKTYANGTDVVSWDNGKEGNYWSDYLTRYPNATEVDSTGIGNIPYIIDVDNGDYYPLLKAAEISLFSPSPRQSPTESPTPTPSSSQSVEPIPTPNNTPENFTPLVIAVSLVTVVTVVGLLVILAKRRGRKT